jgi:hypothetical protein
VALQRPHCVLNDERVVAICRHEICDGRNRVDRGPVKQILELVSHEQDFYRNTYLELERDVAGQLATKKYLKRIWFVQYLVGEVEHLPADFRGQTLRLETLDKMYGNRRVLCPSCLEVGSYSSLQTLAYIYS